MPSISPMPPIALDVGLPWDVEVDDPVAAIADARDRYGDTFVVDSGTDRYLFTFSPRGVQAFYALPEERASKGFADFRMLSRKLPDEIFTGRRVLPFQLFRRDDVAAYLSNLAHAVAVTITELGDAGTVELFGLTRRIAHRMGLGSWGGPGAISDGVFDELLTAFDTLDGAEAFVHPDAMAAVAATGKADESAALGRIVDIIGAGVTALPGREGDHRLFARIVSEWGDSPPVEQARGVALDVALIHIASMSNLAAALGWVIVDLLAHPAEREAIGVGDDQLSEQCALESIRLSQRSIMSRYVLAEVELAVGDDVHTVSSGVTIATLLPLTNTEVAGYDQWCPSRWNRHRLADSTDLPSPELVTAFGHGKHSCPAQPFSLAATTAATTQLFAAYEFSPVLSTHPMPVLAQIGGVARAAEPYPIEYRRRG
jgi:cytochrome P450